MTGSFARTGLQVGSRPQGWMTAPIFAALVMLVATFLHFALADELPDNSALDLDSCGRHRDRAVDGCNPHTIARHRSGRVGDGAIPDVERLLDVSPAQVFVDYPAHRHRLPRLPGSS